MRPGWPHHCGSFFLRKNIRHCDNLIGFTHALHVLSNRLSRFMQQVNLGMIGGGIVGSGALI